MTTVRDLLDRLHDAVLETVELDWGSAIVRVRVRLSVAAELRPARAVIVVEGVTSVSCPRKDPWGPSESVLEADLDEREGASELTIHMQSGDDLVFVGRAVRLEASAQ